MMTQENIDGRTNPRLGFTAEYRPLTRCKINPVAAAWWINELEHGGHREQRSGQIVTMVDLAFDGINKRPSSYSYAYDIYGVLCFAYLKANAMTAGRDGMDKNEKHLSNRFCVASDWLDCPLAMLLFNPTLHLSPENIENTATNATPPSDVHKWACKSGDIFTLRCKWRGKDRLLIEHFLEGASFRECAGLVRQIVEAQKQKLPVVDFAQNSNLPAQAARSKGRSLEFNYQEYEALRKQGWISYSELEKKFSSYSVCQKYVNYSAPHIPRKQLGRRTLFHPSVIPSANNWLLTRTAQSRERFDLREIKTKGLKWKDRLNLLRNNGISVAWAVADKNVHTADQKDRARIIEILKPYMEGAE